MANNKVSSLLNVDLPKPKRSNFNLGRVNRFSADVGWVIPCYVEEVLPNSYKRLDIEALIQTNATVAPLMGSFKVKVDAFFVPLRLYYRHLDLNFIRPDFDDNFDYHYIISPNVHGSFIAPVGPGNTVEPSVYISATRYTSTEWNLTVQSRVDASGNVNTVSQEPINIEVAPSSLLDYLGILPVGYNAMSWSDGFKLNANPFIAYFDIYRNYYANPHDPLVPFRVQNYRQASGGASPASSVFTSDRYVHLSAFDDFINSFSLNYNPSIPYYAKDAIANFKDIFIDTTAPAGYRGRFHSIPLFSGSPFASGTKDSAGNYSLLDTRDGKHFGLLRRTYMDDYFNSRFRNDFVTYMEESSRVLVDENNYFTITQLRMQNRIAKYVDKSIFSDTRFGSWIKAHFGVKTNQKLNIPQFLGSITSNIVFNDIYASAQTGDSTSVTSNTALGSRASLGQGYIKNKGSFVEFQATEPGYLMCMFSIIPYVSYFQGIRKMYLKTSFNDMFKPEFDAVGYDDLQKLEMSAVGYNSDIYSNNIINNPIVPSEYNVSIGKHPAWLEYMTSTDEAHGLMTQRYQYGFWLLNRPYSPSVYDESGTYSASSEASTGSGVTVNKEFNFTPKTPTFDSSTYIQPEYFNTIFAVDKYTDNFQVQMRFFDKTKQPISKQILPHL